MSKALVKILLFIHLWVIVEGILWDTFSEVEFLGPTWYYLKI